VCCPTISRFPTSISSPYSVGELSVSRLSGGLFVYMPACAEPERTRKHSAKLRNSDTFSRKGSSRLQHLLHSDADDLQMQTSHPRAGASAPSFRFAGGWIDHVVSQRDDTEGLRLFLKKQKHQRNSSKENEIPDRHVRFQTRFNQFTTRFLFLTLSTCWRKLVRANN